MGVVYVPGAGNIQEKLEPMPHPHAHSQLHLKSKRTWYQKSRVNCFEGRQSILKGVNGIFH